MTDAEYKNTLYEVSEILKIKVLKYLTLGLFLEQIISIKSSDFNTFAKFFYKKFFQKILKK